MIRSDILGRLGKVGPTGLWIDPLLDEGQIGEVTVDLRLGYDFLVSIVTRRPFIGIVRDDERFRSIPSYFQPTRRELGDRFILYPDQVVLATTLEYIALPSDCYADIFTRSSFTRLGIGLSTMVHPGFRGCFSVELFNHGNNPIELVVGAKMFQMRLTKLADEMKYGGIERKYFGNVRPTPSRAADDNDLQRLSNLSISHRRE
ncbi:dCTP deaminase [Mesorhizobium sp. CA8]|uniref:dCTP deaminase n=1 Tax=unclassified Mesorhizobium TaxID=325217 RepID=UPI001CC8FAAE|nr:MULTISPECIES: dCTP deaminase [unclassified Mesorhizobium]MBZ9764809.1 dCTP deaminase [Mesorhizobium sp. CA8]MBZ9822755.1 dCTP deaminase [Mesorhizobium sp. CA4]